jgi:predicted secreted protein
MTAFTGRDVLIEYAIADENASYAGLTFKTLGMMRGKGIKVSWDTVDTTADKSPQFTKTNLVTFKSAEFSGDGVSYTDAVYNQAELKAHVISPGVATANQPKAWVRQTSPDGVIYGPFIFSEWSSDSPFSDAVTWSTSAMSNGAINFVPA